MQFSLNRTSLLAELSLLQGIVEKKSTIPILSNILMETKGESLISMIATDLDVSLETECASDVSKPGAVVLQAKKLFDIVRSLPESEIKIVKEDNDWVKISCGSSEFRMVGQAKEHFPSIPMLNQEGLEMPSALFNQLVQRTIYAITQEESRYALNGALLMISGGRVTMVATDGHRLALASGKLELSSAGAKKWDQSRAIVPKKALTELLRLTAGQDNAVDLTKDDNHLYFRQGTRKLTSRVLAGQFPNYELVLPKNNDKTVKFDVGSLSQALKRVALMADERSHGVKFEISTGALKITSQTSDVGEARELLPIDYEGDALNIGFNAEYLLDFLGAVGSEEILFDFKDEQSPAMMKPSGTQQDEYSYVVMPMRLL